MSPNFSPTYFLTAAAVLPKPEEVVKEAVEDDVHGQLKQIVMISQGLNSYNYLANLMEAKKMLF